MAVTLNKEALRAATALIRAGHYDMSTSWSFSAEDGDKLLGDGGKDWATYGKWFLGEDDGEAAETKAHFRYPYGKDGKVFRRAVAAIRSRSKQQGDEDVFKAAGELMTAMDDEEEKHQASEDPDGNGEEEEEPNGGDGSDDDDDDRAVVASLHRVLEGMERIERRFGTGPQMQLRQMLGSVAMEHATLDPKERTIDMVVSSGAPVRRYDYDKGREYDEVLQIDPTAIRMDRLNAGAPMLDSHNYWAGTQAMIGAVVPGSARIEAGQLRAQAKFSTTPEGERAFQMAQDGTLRHVSVGYVTHAEDQDETTTPPTYRATDWEPYEVSGVAMPADPKAGFRSATLPHPRIGRTNAMPIADAAAEAVKQDRERAAKIRELGTRLASQGLDLALVEKHAADGTTLDAFRAIALDSIAAGTGAAIDNARGTLPMPAVTGRYKARKLTKRQELGRILRIYGAAKGDPTRAERLARAPEWDDGNRDLQSRALVAGIGASGGFMIPEEYYPEVIELLRARAVVRRLGALQIPMEGGNLTMPRLQGGAVAGYVGEATATNASQEAFGQVKFTERKLMALVPVSNDLLKFASPQADEVVLNDMIAQIAISEDAAFIRGSGTSYTPKGMRYWAPAATNVIVSAGTGLTNFVTDLEAMESALEGANVRMINPAIILNPRSKNAIKLLQATTGQFVFRDEMKDGTLDGYPFGSTNNIPKNLGSGAQTEWYLADMADAVITDVPGLEIEISSEAAYVDSSGTMQAAFSQDVTVLRAIERHDFGMRHDVSVAVMTEVNY